MNIIFVGIFYYGGPVRHLYRIFEIYKALAKVFKAVGISVKYFTRQNEILPLQNTLLEDEFNNDLKNCDLLFMWNGNLGQEKQISERCKTLGIPVYYMELGWLPQCGTFYFDRKGVNYSSSLLDWKHQELTTEQKLETRARITFYLNNHARVTGTRELRDFVFVPFQVENDSQIIRFSSHIKKMQQLVDYVCSFVDGTIIFKTHPKDNIRGIKYPKRCKLYTSGTTHDFLEKCKYVVTINSTVGIEALVYNKPVITIGNAFYEGRGITHKATDDESFKQAISNIEQNGFATGVVEAFLHYLFNRQWYSADLDNPEKVLQLIENITERRADE